MFKRVLAVALCLVMALSACGKESTPTPKSLDLAAFAADVNTLVAEGDEVLEVPENVVADFYGIDLESIKEYKVFLSATSATATEVAVFLVNDSAYLETLKEAATTRIEDKKDSFRDYIPTEMDKLDNALVYTYDNYLLLAAVDNADAAKALFEKHLK